MLVAITLAPSTRLVARQVATPIASVTDGAEAITAGDVRQVIEVIAHDSMGGRLLQSRGLEATASYIAAQFASLGLLPAGNTVDAVWALRGAKAATGASPWIQRYVLPGNLGLRFSGTSIDVMVTLRRGERDFVGEDGGPLYRTVRASFGAVARFGSDTIPESAGALRSLEPPVRTLVLTGRHTPTTISAAKLREHTVVYVPAAGADSLTRRAVIMALADMGNVVVIDDRDSLAFAQVRAANEALPPVIMNGPVELMSGATKWVTYVRPGAVRDVFRIAGVDLTQALADTAPTIRSATRLGLVLNPQFTWRGDADSAMNTVGLLPGTDSVLRNDYVLFSAHMDQVGGVGPDGRPHVGKGSNDNAAGVAALVALAKAFSQPGNRPKRSLLFVATTGLEKYAAGANHFAESQMLGTHIPTLAAVTLDMLDGGPKDSLFVDGPGDLVFETPPAWTADEYSELGVALVDGGTAVTKRSDHAAFVSRTIPTLLFHAGERTDRASAGAAETTDMEQLARRVRLIYYIGREIANATQRPRWTPAGRQQAKLLFGH